MPTPTPADGAPPDAPPAFAVHAVVIAYNAGPWLGEAIASLAGADWVTRLIVVDDGSALPVAQSHGDDLARLGERATLIRQSNGGESAARNTGIAASLSLAEKADPAGRETWLLFVDADDWLHPEAITALRAAHARGCHAVVGAKLEVSPGGAERLREPPEAWRDGPLPRSADVLRFLAVFAATGLAVRHDALRDAALRLPVGTLWDESIRVGPDIEFLYRLARLGETPGGTRVFVSARPTVRYRKHDTGANLSGWKNLLRRVEGFATLSRRHASPEVDALLEHQARWLANQVAKHATDPAAWRTLATLAREQGWRLPVKARVRWLGRRLGRSLAGGEGRG